MAAKRKRKNRKQKGFLQHLASIGFTNRLAICIILFLAAGLAGGFYLARLSIMYGYTGALACYTAAFAPIGTACSIVLSKVVDKSKAENIGGNGDGIKFAMAMSEIANADDSSWESPAI